MSVRINCSMMTNDSKPVFVQLNNKKLYGMRSQEALTPEHEEIVKFVSESELSVVILHSHVAHCTKVCQRLIVVGNYHSVQGQPDCNILRTSVLRNFEKVEQH